MAYAPKPEFNDFVKNQFYKGWNDTTSAAGDWREQGDKAWLSYNQQNDPVYQATRKQEELTKQAIGTLEAQKPVIGQIYGQKREVLQSQLDPTKQRYDALIADLKGQQQTSEESAQLTVNKEMAKRGITQSSGLSDMTMLNTLNPIRREYAGLTQQTGLAQEADLKKIQDAIALLFGEEATANMSLAGLISQAQMGGASNALSAGNLLMTDANNQAQLAAQQAQAQADQNYQNAVLAMQQQLQPYQVTSADLANQAAQLALNKANKPAASAPAANINTYLGGAKNNLNAQVDWGNDSFWKQYGL